MFGTTAHADALKEKILPMRERAKVMDDLLKHRLDRLVPELMRREGIDAWVIMSREYNEDPVLKTMLPATWLSARRRTVFIFLDHGREKGVERLAAARYGVTDIFKGSWNPEEEPDQWRRIADILDEFNPKTIGLNFSDDWAHADGLVYSERRDFVNAIPDRLRTRIVSAERLAVGWLETRTEKEMDLFTAGNIDGKKITAEVCVHHMFFNESFYSKLGNQIKCNPSIKYESDRTALIKALLENKIDIIATDHAPHTWDEKNNTYTQAPAGLPLVQHGMQILMDFYDQKIISLETVVEKTSHNVARRFQIKDRGFIREGYFADIAILDIDKPYTVSKENILYKCGWSPFDGHNFKSSIFMTIVNGNIAFRDGIIADDLPFGMQIEFNR